MKQQVSGYYLPAVLGEGPPWLYLDRVALDLLGPVPQTYSGNKYLLVVTDYFTRYLLYPT
jgi:hypothetical protein